MTTTAPVQQTFTDYLNSVGVDDDIVIGSIVWYTISKAKVTYPDLVEWFDELGLDSSFLPNDIKPVDAYRAATGSRVRFHYDLDDGNSVELLVREVDSTSDMVVRHIMRELRDPGKRRLSYEKVGEAIFYRPQKSQQHKVRFSVGGGAVDTAERAKIETFVQGVEQRYHELAEFLQSQALRAVIRNYLVFLNALPVKQSGGVYFVSRTRQDILNSLQELVSRFDSGGDSSIHQIPLLDTGDQREMLSSALGDEVSKRCGALMDRLAALNERYDGQKIPADQFAKASSELQDIIDKTEEHVRDLDLGRESADATLDIAKQSLLTMMDRVEL